MCLSSPAGIPEDEVLDASTEPRLKARAMGLSLHRPLEEWDQHVIVIRALLLKRRQIVTSVPTEVRNADAMDASRLEDPVDLGHKRWHTFTVDVLENVRVVNRVNRARISGNALSQVMHYNVSLDLSKQLEALSP